MAACLAWLITAAPSGCAAPYPHSGPVDAAGDIAIYVIDRGWHTDIGLQPPGPRGQLAVFRRTFPGARFLVFGFGERAYYTGADRNLGTMLRALLPSPSAILVTALRGTPAEAFGAGHVVALHLSRAGVERVIRFIWNDLPRDAAGRPLLLAEGPYPGSLFYASSGTYDLLHTCNTWTAEALDAGGEPVQAFGTVFAAQVMDQVRRIAAHAEI